jgi:hypothetical protein
VVLYPPIDALASSESAAPQSTDIGRHSDEGSFVPEADICSAANSAKIPPPCRRERAASLSSKIGRTFRATNPINSLRRLIQNFDPTLRLVSNRTRMEG